MNVLDRIRGGLVVSCQAPPGSPLDRPDMIAAMAATAERAGAVGVRVNRPENIRAVRAIVRIPIIGIFKQMVPGRDVYITPDFEAAAAVVYAGADIVALDATARRPRGYEAASELILGVQQRLARPVMADIATVEDGVAAERAGVALVATTLLGYTAETRGARFTSVELVRRLVANLSTPVICEGRVNSPRQVASAFKAGAFGVVVGTAITGIEARTRQFVAATRSQTEPPGGTVSGTINAEKQRT